MRVIFPILITALWAAASVDIEGVWQPVQPTEQLLGAIEHLETPSQSMMAQFQDAIEPAQAPKFKLIERLESLPNIHHHIKEVRIALPVIPRVVIPAPPSRPVCG
ncbi:MAG: hypothetical protein AAGJ52_14930 [Pseudomonadota bacterium]